MSFVRELVAVGADPDIGAKRRALVAHSPWGQGPPGRRLDERGALFVYNSDVAGERERAIEAASAWIAAETAAGLAVDFLFVEVDPDAVDAAAAASPPVQRTAAAPGYAFISYSSKDKPTADAICAVMEQHGVRCWITPRDILPGHDWAESILRAIAGARVVVLIFSASANNSPQVRREIERAVHNEAPIIPFRIEDTAPSESLEYFISTPHWLDAITPPLEAHAIRLAESALALLREPAGKP